MAFEDLLFFEKQLSSKTGKIEIENFELINLVLQEGML